jgi:alpha-galactosidase
MIARNATNVATSALVAVAMTALVMPASAKEIPEQLPDPSGEKPDSSKPVQVYILTGQSNMVGMGTIAGGNRRANPSQFFVDTSDDAENGAQVSLYKGAYDPDADYDQMKPVKTAVASFGATSSQRSKPFPKMDGPFTAVVRGALTMPTSGLWEFNPGYKCETILYLNGEKVQQDKAGSHDWSGSKPVELKAGKKYPFKLIYTGSNANANFWQGRRDFPGTLNTLTKRQGKFPHLIDDEGNWTTRQDVTYKGVISSVGQGPLKPGVSGKTFGPELGFGHVLGIYHEAPVLLIKASIGNRSLGWDILPPGSEQYTHDGYVYAGYKDSPSRWKKGTDPEPINWYAGRTYDRFIKHTNEVLNNFDKNFPQYADQGYEIAGFVWWQGHKDGGSEAHAMRYEQNLVNLIDAYRNEFDAPNAPFAVATIGFGGKDLSGKENYKTIWEAQMAVGDPDKHPELADTVVSTDIRDFWRSKEQSPSGQGYHYNRNAETYYLVGEALGRDMVKLLEGEK